MLNGRISELSITGYPKYISGIRPDTYRIGYKKGRHFIRPAGYPVQEDKKGQHDFETET